MVSLEWLCSPFIVLDTRDGGWHGNGSFVVVSLAVKKNKNLSFLLWLQNLKVTEQYVSKVVFISDGTWIGIFHDLPDIVGIPFGIEMLNGEYKETNFQNAAAFSPLCVSLLRVVFVE